MHFLDATRSSSLATLSGFESEFRVGAGYPVAVFDFDGVLCDPVEDRVYKLPEEAGERLKMSELARVHRLDPDLFDTPYLRHLLLQIILGDQGVIPDDGPLLRLAQEMTAARHPFFILTARSGQAAIKRVLAFIEHAGLAPQEIFCVGRAPKGRQLTLVRKTVALPTRIVYFDDSVRHVRNSFAQEIDGLETVHVAWPNADFDAARILWANTLAWAQTQDPGRRAA